MQVGGLGILQKRFADIWKFEMQFAFVILGTIFHGDLNSKYSALFNSKLQMTS